MTMPAMQYHEWQFRIPDQRADEIMEALAIVDFTDVVSASEEAGISVLSLFSTEPTLPTAVLTVLADQPDMEPLGNLQGDLRSFLAETPVEVAPGWWVVTQPDDDHHDATCVVQVPLTTAFGDGRHPSTKMAAQLLQSIDVTGKHVLDVGCGTGVLGVLASLSGAASVGFSDIETESVQMTAKVCELAGVKPLGIWQSDLFAAVPQEVQADIFIANLYADLLQVIIADERMNQITPHGYLLLSGIAQQHAEDVRSVLAEHGWTIQAELNEAWWHCMLARR